MVLTSDNFTGFLHPFAFFVEIGLQIAYDLFDVRQLRAVSRFFS